MDTQKHHRRSIRVPEHDYASPGGYFVTIVTWQRECLFGEVVNGEMRLNTAGKIVQWEWERLPQRFDFIGLGAYTVMPNHFHGTIFFYEMAGATRSGLIISAADKTVVPALAHDDFDGSPLPRGPSPASLGAIIGQFKSRVTKHLWKIPALANTPIWQRNYYEHIIRNNDELNRIHAYITTNPIQWEKDEENPGHV